MNKLFKKAIYQMSAIFIKYIRNNIVSKKYLKKYNVNLMYLKLSFKMLLFLALMR